jgi:hypothetical protein
MRRLGIAAFSLSLSASAASVDQAVPPSGGPSGASGLETDDRRELWERGRMRTFLAATLDFGWTYARPAFQAGWGRPYYRYMALEAAPIATVHGVGSYVGTRGSMPNLDLRTGVRYFAPFERTLLEPKLEHSRLDIESDEGRSAEMTVLEAELSASLPIAHGGPFTVLTAYHLPGLPDDAHVFEESLRMVIKPPWLWRARWGYAVHFGKQRAFRLGLAEEVLVNPGRGVYVLRAGLVGSIAIADDVDVHGSFLPVISSPDEIGLAGADYGFVGVRFRFATGAGPARAR